MCVLVRDSIAVIKHHEQMQLGEGRVYSIFEFIVHHPEKSGQELKQGKYLEATEGTAYCLVLHGLLSMLSYSTRTTSPG